MAESADRRRSNSFLGRPNVVNGAQQGASATPYLFDHVWQSSSSSSSDQGTAFLDYYGPSSFLAICSEEALDWLRARVVADDENLLTKTIDWLARDVHRRFNLDCISHAVQTPEPDADTAWRYSQEYFNCRADSYLGVVDRTDFERRLRKDYEDTSRANPDPGWCALRNIIYALGARLLMSKKGYDPKIIHAHAWHYFENALSVHSRILFSPQKDLNGVRALALMSFYADNTLCSSVEYTLCSDAVRLAQALGLNQEQPSSRQGGVSEVAQRSRIWWALYCFDKVVSVRLGRPSCIDDDNISCPFPQPQLNENMNNIDIFMMTIRHAQLSSKTHKALISAGAHRPGGDGQRRATLENLAEELYQWRDSLPIFMQPGTPVKQWAIPPGVHVDNVVYWHYAFYGTIIAIHNQFPWTIPFAASQQSPSLCQHATESREKVLDAARNIILATRHHQIDINTAGCLVYSYPMLSVVVLFVYVLQDPMLASAQSDVVLLDVAAGHFAKLELATSMQLDVQFVRDIANIARRAVQAVKEQWRTDSSFSELDMTAIPDMKLSEAPEACFVHMTIDDLADLSQIDNLNFMDFLADDLLAT